MPFCGNCGQPVNERFCTKCGHPVASDDKSTPPSASASATTPDVAMGVVLHDRNTEAESYDCLLCSGREGAIYQKSMKRKVSGGGTICNECAEPIEQGKTYYQCNVEWTRSIFQPWECRNVVCEDCVRQSRLQREHSRWNHNDRKWKSSLLGCDGQVHLTCCACMSYYNLCNGPLFPLRLDPNFSIGKDLSWDYVLYETISSFVLTSICAIPTAIVCDIFGLHVKLMCADGVATRLAEPIRAGATAVPRSVLLPMLHPRPSATRSDTARLHPTIPLRPRSTSDQGCAPGTPATCYANGF